MICLHKEDKKSNCPLYCNDSVESKNYLINVQHSNCSLRICVTCGETTQECKEYETTPPYASDLSTEDHDKIYDYLDTCGSEEASISDLKNTWTQAKYEYIKTQGREKAIEMGYLDEDWKWSLKFIEEYGWYNKK